MSTPRKHGTPRKDGTPAGLPPRFTPRKTPTRKTPRKTPTKKTTPAVNAEPVPNEQGEEGITVAIRMRPLNDKETNNNRVWRVLPQYNSVTQTTNNGQPLPERVTGRTFFTFDKIFGEDAQNPAVYDGVAKGIVDSVMSGLNGTIFAYGQTSSGKTYTMQGSGSIEEGYSNGGGGIVHMAANDIFDHVQQAQDRIFLIRASFIEIYNEEVRDLLGDNSVLAVREDPRRGVFVNATEEISTDFEGLLRILFSGEKNRAVAATGMNERSSRSHTIFRITIESRAKSEENDENDMNGSNLSLPDDDGAVRISTLNLVDLAGSESVRHTGSTGDRQKEGGKINQSLLTLSRVIVGLGQPNQAHINFRDSKLTRILQPSLSGNARMAVICCATASELYLEETRSTLLFASRAKLVKTRAQVNEVLDDQSLIKRLQRELAEARRQSTGPRQLEHIRALETEAMNAGTAARNAETKLNKLKASLLNHAAVFGDKKAGATDEGVVSEVVTKTKKRRLSDGHIAMGSMLTGTPLKVSSMSASSPQSVPHAQKRTKPVEWKGPLSPSTELDIVKEAYSAKVDKASALEELVREMKRNLASTESSLSQANDTLTELRAAKDEAVQESEQLSSEISSLFTEMQASMLRHENAVASKDSAISELVSKLELEQTMKGSLEETVKSMKNETEALKERCLAAEEKARVESTKAAEVIAQLNDTINAISSEKSDLDTRLQQKQSEHEASMNTIKELEAAKQGLEGRVESLSQECARSAFDVSQLIGERERLVQENERQQQQIQETSGELNLLKATMHDIVDKKGTLADKLDIANQALADLQSENKELRKSVTELTETVDKRNSSIESLNSCVEGLERRNKALVDTLSDTQSKLEGATSEGYSLTTALETNAETITNLERAIKDGVEKYESAVASLSAEKQALAKKVEMLGEQVTRLSSEVDEAHTRVNALTSDLEAKNLHIADISKSVKVLQTSLEDVEKENVDLNAQLTETKSLLEETSADRDGAKSEILRMNSMNNRLREEITQLKTQIESNLQRIDELTGEICDTKAVLDSAKTDTEKLATLLHTCTLELEQAQSDAEVAASEITSSKEEIDSLKSALGGLTMERDSLQSQLDAVVADKGSVEETVAVLEASKNEVNALLTEVLSNIEDLRAENRALEDDCADKQASLVSKSNELQEIYASFEESREQVASLQLSIDEAMIERVELKTKLENVLTEIEGTGEHVAKIEASRNEVDGRLVASVAQVEELKAENKQLTNSIADCRLAVEIKSKELQDARNSIENDRERIAILELTIADIMSERDHLKTRLDGLIAEKGSVTEIISTLETSKDEMTTKIDALREEKRTLTEDCATKEASLIAKAGALQDAQLSLQECREQIAFLQSSIVERDSERDELKTQLEGVIGEKRDLEDRVVAVENLKNEADARLADVLTQAAELQVEKRTLENDIAACRAYIDAKSQELREMHDALKVALREVHALQNAIVDTGSLETKAVELKLAQVEDEATELKQLLAAANDSVNEAREAALAAADELDDKDKALESNLHQLSQLEEELRVATEELSRIGGQGSSSAQNGLERHLELLTQEIAIANESLEKQKKEWVASEEELRRIHAEEHRALVQEAEGKIAVLNVNISKLASSLTSAEAEAYSLQQEIDDLHDQNKRLESKALEADLLRQSEHRLKEQVSTLSEARLALQAELTRVKQDLDSRVKDNDREAVATTAELNRAKSESYAAKQESIDLKEEVQRLQEEKSSSIREVRVLRDKSAALASTVSRLEDENDELASRLRNLDHAKLQEKDYVRQIKELQLQIKELESSLNVKDARINKLEKVKLTKEKIQAIAELKAERIQFLQDAEEYKEKFSLAEKTIAQLQSKIARVSRDVAASPDADEMASMKFAKEALETKLRKFAAHCQYLENERANVIDALNTIHGCDVRDGNIERAVIAICDKQSSVEEDADHRVSSYLSELNDLRETNMRLQNSFAAAEKKLASMNQSEADISRKLQEAKEKVESLRKERDHLKALAESERGNVESEKSHQVRYLEEENLRLMLDLKNAKKQIKSTRAQLDAMRLKVVDDDTEDLGSIVAHALEAPRKSINGDTRSFDFFDPVSPADKENQRQNTPARQSGTPNVTESSKKRRFAGLPRSAKRTRGTQEATTSRALGLGEMGSENDDQTGECNQS